MAGRGRLVSREAWRQQLIKGLLRCYQDHQPFMAELDALRRRCRRLLRALRGSRRRPTAPGRDPLELWRLTRRVADEDLLDGQARRRSPHTFLKRYLAELEELAQRWGLDAPWAAPILHDTLVRDVPLLWPVRTVVTPKLRISVSLDHIPYLESWEEFEERLLREARQRRDQLLQALQQEGLDRMDTRHRQEEHLRWVFWLACPGHVSPRTYGALARKLSQEKQRERGCKHPPDKECPDCYVHPNTVRQAVRPLARELELRLPTHGRGRPSKVAPRHL